MTQETALIAGAVLTLGLGLVQVGIAAQVPAGGAQPPAAPPLTPLSLTPVRQIVIVDFLRYCSASRCGEFRRDSRRRDSDARFVPERSMERF